jgi:hypothetical protein
MAQAPAYNRAKNFLENNPDRTDHGALNTELDKLSLSVNGLRDNAALLQKDDGTLKDGVILPSNLSAQALALLQGPVGPAGPTGPTGPTGPQGAKGETGDVGASFDADAKDVLINRAIYNLQGKGFSFLAMDTGQLFFKLSNTAADWSPGLTFGKGETGAQGAQGAQGIQGAQGVQGPTGPKGDTGPAGVNGTDGAVVSIDTGLKTASLIGKSSITAQLKLLNGQLQISLSTS